MEVDYNGSSCVKKTDVHAILRDRSLFMTGGGGVGVKLLFMENILAAHSACGEKISRPTRHRTKIFRCTLL